MTFAEFWDVITGNAAKPRLDPLVEVSKGLSRRPPVSDVSRLRPNLAPQAQHYLARHKLVTLIENMAASILYEKPDDPRQFLIQKLVSLTTRHHLNLCLRRRPGGVFARAATEPPRRPAACPRRPRSAPPGRSPTTSQMTT